MTILALSNGYIVKVDKTSLTDWDGTAAHDFTSRLRMWFGSQGPRKMYSFEVVYESITDDKSVSVRSWTTDKADVTPRETQYHQPHTNTMQSYPIGPVPAEGVGRFAALEIEEPEGCSAPIVNVTIKSLPEE